MNRNIYGISK